MTKGRSQPGGRARADRRPATLASIRTLFNQGMLDAAEQQTRAFLARHKRDPFGHLLMAAIAEQRQDLRWARTHALKALSDDAESEACMILCRLERHAGRTDDALKWCDRALKVRPGHLKYRIQKASVLEEAARFADARSEVDAMITGLEGKPLPPDLRVEIAKLLVQEQDYDGAISTINDLVGEPGIPPGIVRLLHFLQAKACDRAGRYGEAFDAATRGNEIGRLDFDPAAYDAQVTTLIEAWSAERMERFPRSACEDELPVFVAGMPRSGTSLVEQIIDAHPRAGGLGELTTIEQFANELHRVYDPDQEPPACFGRLGDAKWTRTAREYVRQARRLAPKDSIRVVNKALGNQMLVGLLARLFPKTRIVHVLRDPRDVAISCYMGGFNNRAHPWTTRLDWAAGAWEQSSRMMRHWQDALDVPILEVRYEQLVRDPDTQFPRLIEFLGLDWDDACRDFHRSRRTVRTLSYDQVNRPLYTTAAGRHANYASQLAGVAFPAYAPEPA